MKGRRKSEGGVDERLLADATALEVLGAVVVIDLQELIDEASEELVMSTLEKA